MSILDAFAIALVIFCIGTVIRTNWVYRQRMKVLHKNKTHPNISIKEALVEYDALISWNAMMLRWWVWDIEKLKKPIQGSEVP